MKIDQEIKSANKMEITKHYRTKEVSFSMELTKTSTGKIEIPIYAKMPANVKFDQMKAGISESDFDDDMKIMIPESLGADWFASCFKQFQFRLKMHFNQFGRIQPADLECFIGEYLLVTSSIGKALNQPFSLTDKQSLFKKFLIDISEELNIPVQIPL